jgi:predicted RNA binding protein YcfA (HicA-like mRNA interferase family)
MPKTVSGEDAVKILTKHFGFTFISQKGSYAKLKRFAAGRTDITIVPLHRELLTGTLRGVPELAKVDFKEFQEYI